MGDPFSIIVGVIGAIDGSISLAERVVVVVDNYKHAEKQLSELRQQIDINRVVAIRFKAFINEHRELYTKDEAKLLESHFTRLSSDLKQCDTLVEESSGATIKDKIKWAFTLKSQCTALLTELKDWNNASGQLLSIQIATVVGRIERANVTFEENMLKNVYGMSIQVKAVADAFATNDPNRAIATDTAWIGLSRLVDYPPEDDDGEERVFGRMTIGDDDQTVPVIIECLEYGELEELPTTLKNRRKQLAQLALTLRNLRDATPQILQCHGVVDDVEGSCFLVISDGTSTKSLADAIRDDRIRPSIAHRIKLASEIASAVRYVHEAGFVHKSICSQNVILDEDASNAQLTGFGVARDEDGVSYMLLQRDWRMDLYQAPEMMVDKRDRYSVASDVYGVGAVLLELGLWEPLEEIPELELAVKSRNKQALVLTKAANGLNSGKLGEKVCDDYKALVLSCFRPFSEGRPYIQHVVERLTSMLTSVTDNESG